MRALWIDPRWFERQYAGGRWYEPWSVTTDRTAPVAPVPRVDEERIRKIVREESAELPIQFDVPDTPPADDDDDGKGWKPA